MTLKDEAAVKLVFDACLFFGTALSTAHKVAALFAEDIERMESD